MKRSNLLLAFIIVCLTAGGTALGQKGCDFDIIGTWKPAEDGEKAAFYRYAADGTVTVLSGSGKNSELREIASATYKLDSPAAPRVIEFTANNGAGIFPQGKTSVEITRIDDVTFTSVGPGSSGRVRWIKVNPYRHFVVLAARTGPPREGGPAFALLIKTGEREMKIESIGLFFDHGRRSIGAIPSELYREFMTEPHADSDVMLRLELTPAEFERCLKIGQTWQRRARNHELLYQGTPHALNLNNAVLLKEIVESLNQCSEKIKLYKLDWALSDEIAVKYRPPHIPFHYFKKLRQLNESLHVKDDKFHERVGSR